MCPRDPACGDSGADPDPMDTDAEDDASEIGAMYIGASIDDGMLPEDAESIFIVPSPIPSG